MRSVETFWKPYVYELLLEYFPPVIEWRERSYFAERSIQILASPDNKKIPRHPDAGKIIGDYQVMHNGLKIILNSYNDKVTDLFKKNQGVHEPAEEYAFQVMLENVPDTATMIELGANWSFYSMWFCSRVKNPKVYMVEPDKSFLEFGKKNFELNSMQGQFFNYIVGQKSGTWRETKRSLFRGTYESRSTLPMVGVDDFIEENKIDFVDILHSDIQGAELDMLKGAERSIAQRKFRYFCISTHSDQVHRECIEFLKARNFSILCEVDYTHCMHIDGFLVARADEYAGPESIAIHKLD